MNIIFLDIDGVLNSKFWDESHQMEISDGKYIDTEKVSLLSKIVNSTKASIVLHSGWRFWFDEKLKPTRKEAEHLVSILEKEGLSISGVTPDLTTEEIRKTKKFSKVKADEILTWLYEHPDTENWLVLDDLDLHNEEIATHQVMTDSEYGLTEDDVLKAIKILNMQHQAVAREVMEETGQTVDKCQYVSSYYFEPKGLIMIGFIAYVKKTSFAKSNEVDDHRWYKIHEIENVIARENNCSGMHFDMCKKFLRL